MLYFLSWSRFFLYDVLFFTFSFCTKLFLAKQLFFFWIVETHKIQRRNYWQLQRHIQKKMKQSKV